MQNNGNDNWQEFKDYWDAESPRNGAIAGAIGGAIGGILASAIIALFIWCCLKYIAFLIQKTQKKQTQSCPCSTLIIKKTMSRNYSFTIFMIIHFLDISLTFHSIKQIK
jgi:hypothetical protein